MKNLFYSLAFMLIGATAFANTTKKEVLSITNTEITVGVEDLSIADGCWVTVLYVNTAGAIIGRGRYWDANCDIVGGIGIKVVVK